MEGGPDGPFYYSMTESHLRIIYCIDLTIWNLVYQEQSDLVIMDVQILIG